LLSLGPRAASWQPPVVRTIATENCGIEELAGAISSFQESQLKSAIVDDRRRAIARWRILELLREQLLSRTLDHPAASEALNRLADEVASRRRDPYSAVEEIIRGEQ